MTAPPSAFVPTAAEQKLLDAARAGEVAEYQPQEERTLRAEIVAALATGVQDGWTVHRRGLRVRGARIEGPLDLQGARLISLLELVDCELGDPLTLADADVRSLRLSGSRVPGILARRLVAHGALLLDRMHCAGEVQLRDARIEGTLDAEGARFENPEGTCFDGIRLSVQGSVFLGGKDSSETFHARGTFSLVGAQIASLGAAKAMFENPGGVALAADGLHTRGSVLLRDATLRGRVRFLYADIGLTLDCSGASLSCPGGVCLEADGLKTGRSLFLREGFHSEGEISLLGAQIGTHFDCCGAILRNAGEVALRADAIQVRGIVFLGQTLQAEGTVILRLARMASLEADGASLDGGAAEALVADEISTDGTIFLNGLKARGAVSFVGAEIGGNLLLSEAILEGGVLLARLHVGGDLDCAGASFLDPGPGSFNAARMEVAGSLIWRGLAAPPAGLVTLSSATVGRLVDDAASWPGEIRIDNFTYGSFEQGAPLADERLGWLRRQKRGEFSPQPYEQAVQVLRRMGHDKEARRIAQAKHEDLRRTGKLGGLAWLWNVLLGLTMGHGYQVWRALLALLVIIGIGALVFNRAYDAGAMLELKPGSLARAPKFEPLTYSVDVCLPIIDLHQERYYLPLPRGDRFWFYRFYFWLHIGLGWILSTVAVTGLTGLVKKD